LVFDLRTEPTAKHHIAQVGIARTEPSTALDEGRLDVTSQLQQAVFFTATGDVMCVGGGLEAVAPGVQGSGLTQRMADWCVGGPSWLIGPKLSARVLLEVDLRQGRISVSVGEWSEEPAIISAPLLVDVAAAGGRPWMPIVALTAVGQEARIVDLTVRAEM